MQRHIDKFDEDYEKLQQKKRQKKLHEYRENEKQKAVNTRRLIIIGELFVRYFPDALKFQPHLTDAENAVEFAPLEAFLSKFSSDIYSNIERTQSTSKAGNVSVRFPTQNNDDRNGGRG